MSKDKIITATEIEDFDDVDVVEVLVAPGDTITVDQSIVTLESDKAMMEFPSTDAGVVKSVAVAVGDKINQGDELITLTLQQEDTQKANEDAKKENQIQETIAKQNKKSDQNNSKQDDSTHTKISANKDTSSVKNDKAYASPAVRKYANELGVDLGSVSGSAKQGRVLKQDVQTHVQNVMSGNQNTVSKTSYKLPDFNKFGKTEEKSLNKLRQVSAQHLHHAWNVAPHVTQFDDADITQLEVARKQLKQQTTEQGIKLTLLPFVMKALVKCLQEFPDFNSSLNQDVTTLIVKQYYNLGIAVDTPRGLVVPVIQHVDSKKIPQLAKELMEVSQAARDNKLKPSDMQGGSMSITSLGGIGGKHFTPIINFPEVAILGISRAEKKLVQVDGDIEERLMLPLSLSYDHRAIDGVAAVKFITSLKNTLGDVWSLMI